MKPALALTLLVFFTNCKAPQIVYKEVKVPVAIPCPPPPDRRPLVLPLHQIPSTSTEAEIARAIYATIEYLRLRWEESETILDGYRVEKK